jgi:hypothetical protein
MGRLILPCHGLNLCNKGNLFAQVFEYKGSAGLTKKFSIILYNEVGMSLYGLFMQVYVNKALPAFDSL